LTFAHRLADIADAITFAAFERADHAVETKPDRSPVTQADRDTEDALRTAITRAGRGESVLGEEYGDDGGDRKWIIDPIDGTSSFLRGVPVFATLLALQIDGAVQLGMATAPALRRRWWALRGEGACVDGARCTVSHVDRIEAAAVSTTSQRRMPPGWQTIVQRAWTNRGFGDFWHHCLVAQGSLDIATDGPYMRTWDYSAVQLIVEEAGGMCSTLAGAAPSDGGSFISTNGLLHREAIELLGAS
jgi:histidinol-phosphatase